MQHDATTWFSEPTPSEYALLEKTYPFQTQEDAREAFTAAMQTVAHELPLPHCLSAGVEVHEQCCHLSNRVALLRRTYVRAKFHFDKGKPNNEGLAPTSRDGCSEAYRPDFNDPDELAWRDMQFFDEAEVFYQKLFTALDHVAHVLNLAYRLGMKNRKVSFPAVCDKLLKTHPKLSDRLGMQVQASPPYEQAKQYRDDITHNHQLGSIHGRICRSEEPLSFALTEGKYETPYKVMDNIIQCLDLLTVTLTTITQYQSEQAA